MVKSFTYALLLFSLGFVSCNLDDNNDDCDPSLNCNTVEPFQASLRVKVTIDAENPRVPVAIYFGPFESGALALLDTLGTEEAEYTVPVDEYYSVTAEYHAGADVILAVDGDETRATSDENCSEICWTVQNARVDLRRVP